MKELSERLLAVLDAAEPKLRSFSGGETTRTILKGGWSRKQVVGHLIDSALNNHQRFVRAALQDTLEFPGYDQDGNVRVQDLSERGLADAGEFMGRIQSIPGARFREGARLQT